MRFAIVLGNEAEIRVNRYSANFGYILTILTFGSAILHIWSAMSGFRRTEFRSMSWILMFWSSRSGFRVGRLEFGSLGLDIRSLRLDIWS